LTKEELDEQIVQKENIPEERGGHAMFSCEDESFICLGGYTIKTENRKKIPQNCNKNLMRYNINENEWSEYQIVGEESLLERSNFGSVMPANTATIYFTGGISHKEKPYKVLKINSLVKITFQGRQATVTIVELNMMQKKLHSFTNCTCMEVLQKTL
jgi:hypothetical protein